MSASASPATTTDVTSATADFGREWQAWHEAHELRRADRHGFLAVTSLNWLSEHPQRIEGVPGNWWVEDSQAVVDLGDDETIEADGRLLQGPRLHRFPCLKEREGVTARSGRLLLEIAKRGGHIIVRPRDPEYGFLAAYEGTPAYEPTAAWRLDARFEAFETPREVTVGAAVEGLEHVYASPGRVLFDVDGEERSLTAFNGPTPGTLMVLFTDATSGVTTYAANRAITLDRPRRGGDGVVLDFNRSVNLPCAYTVFATCPLPPAENRLPFAVEAGEQTPLAKVGEPAA